MALLVLGPSKLPGALRSVGQWIRKLKNLTSEVRHQSGIDDVLRAEGFEGGLNELRSVLRGGTSLPARAASPQRQSAKQRFVPDMSREYPPEGPDIYDALPEDLLGDSGEDDQSVAPHAPSGNEVQAPEPSAREEARTTYGPPRPNTVRPPRPASERPARLTSRPSPGPQSPGGDESEPAPVVAPTEGKA